MLAGFFLLINLLGFLLMGYDKSQARRGRWRISEATFFFIGLIGGALGLFLAMRVYRHKTKHLSFVIGIPLMLIINIVFYWLLI
jgi:uncharacterized membrane protein YsdA (DUF1294 family)